MQQEEVLIAQNLNQFICNATITECILGIYTLKKSECEVVIFISHILLILFIHFHCHQPKK